MKITLKQIKEFDINSPGNDDLLHYNGATLKWESTPNVQMIPMSYLDTDTALTADSDLKVASQHAVKTYIAAKVPYYHNHQAGIEDTPVITEGTGGDAGKFSVAASQGWFFDDVTMDTMTLHTIVASGWISPTDDTTGYICQDRDTDSWTVLYSVSLIDYQRYIPYFIVFKRTGSTGLHFQKISLHAHGEIEKHHQRIIGCAKYDREAGALESISVDASLNITASGGGVWAANYRYQILDISTLTRQFKCVNTIGSWSVTSNTNPVLNNLQWNDVSAGYDTLSDNTRTDGYTLVVDTFYEIVTQATLDFTTVGAANNTPGTIFKCTVGSSLGSGDSVYDGYYNITYLYRGIEDQDHCYTVLSTSQYETSVLAQADNVIPAIPELISSHAIFVGRIISQKRATSNFIIESAFKTIFSASTAVTAHGSLSGLSSDDHSAIYYNKTYIDNLTLGITWHDSIQLANVIGNASSPQTAVHLDGYIIDTGGNTGAWSAFAPGDLVQYQTSAWVKIKSLVAGDRIGIAFKSATTPIGLMTGKKDYLAVVVGLAGSFTYTFDAPLNNDGVIVDNPNVYYYNSSFVYSTSLIGWMQMSSTPNLSFGTGLVRTINNITVSANLASLSGLTYASASFVKMTAGGTFALDTNTYLTAVTAHNLLSATHGDALTESVIAGDMIVGNATPKWSRLAKGTAYQHLKMNVGATAPEWATVTRSLYATSGNFTYKSGYAGAVGSINYTTEGLTSSAHAGTGGNQAAERAVVFVLPQDFNAFTSLRVGVLRTGTPNSFTVTMKKTPAWPFAAGSAATTDGTISASDITPTNNNTWEIKTLTPSGTYAAGDIVTIQFNDQVDNGVYAEVGFVELKYNAK